MKRASESYGERKVQSDVLARPAHLIEWDDIIMTRGLRSTRPGGGFALWLIRLFPGPSAFHLLDDGYAKRSDLIFDGFEIGRAHV